MIKKLTTLAAMLLTAAFIMEVPKVSAYDDREFIEKCGKRLGYEYLGTTEHGKEKQEMYDELYELCCEIWESDKDIPYWKEVNIRYNETEKREAYPYIKIYEGSYDEILTLSACSKEVLSMLKFDNPLFYFLNEYAPRVDDEDETNDYLTDMYWKFNDQAALDHSTFIDLDYYKYQYMPMPADKVEGKFYLGILAYEEYMSGSERASLNDDIYDYVTKTSAELDKKETIYDKVLFLHDKIITESEYDFKGIDLDPSIIQTYIPIQMDSHNIIGVMLKNTGVCESYAEVFDTVMNYAGLEDILITGGGHAWNMVKFDDGEYYFVDTTWDDDGAEPKYDFFKKGPNYFSQSASVVRGGETTIKGSHGIDMIDGQYVTCNYFPLPIDKEHAVEVTVPGDVNNDSKVDIEDAVLILSYINGKYVFDDSDIVAADLDHSGVIDISDAVSLIGYINGTIPIR